MRKFLLLLAFFSAKQLKAQDETIKNLQSESAKTITKDPNDTIPKKWKTGGTFSLNLSQGSLSNWSAGGEKFSLSANTYINGHAYYKNGNNSWDNSIDYYLGYVKTTSQGTRKNDDRLDITSKYGRGMSPKVSLSGLFNLRTQFFQGYEYPDQNTKNLISDFLAPAYILLSPGFDYKPFANLSFFVSPATARWVIVKDTSLSTKYSLPAGETSNFEFGAYASINYSANFGKNVTYKGKLDLFSNYKHNPQNVDLYFTNQFALKISKVLSATYSLTLIYDDDIRQFGDNGTSPGLQLQSLFGVGLLYKF